MSKNVGILYALKNQLWQGNIKCGLTTQKIEKRISTLQTSLFIDCEIISTTNQLVNCKIYEFLLKIVLKYYRIRDDREFFNVDKDVIKEIFETFNYLNSILDTDEKLNNYIERKYPEYFDKKRKSSTTEKKLKKKKGLYVNTTY